jgi:hypothetical protein
MYTYCSPKKCIHIVPRKLSFINLKLCISSTFLKLKNKDYLLCRIVCGKNSPSHSRRKNKVSCDVNSAYLKSFHHRRPKSAFYDTKVENNILKNEFYKGCFGAQVPGEFSMGRVNTIIDLLETQILKITILSI